MSHETPIHIVVQRTDSDCTIAVLAMLTGLSYEDVLIAAARLTPCENGMYLTQVQKVAEELGVDLAAKKVGRYDPEASRGILHVSKRKQYHVVILDRGRIIETDGSLWDYDVYLASSKYKPGSLLVMEE